METDDSADAADITLHDEINADWYHGRVSRIEAESRVLYAGQFLVRDCISKPGQYVLTCNWDGRPVHFMINRIILDAKKEAYGFPKKFNDISNLKGSSSICTNDSSAVSMDENHKISDNDDAELTPASSKADEYAIEAGRSAKQVYFRLEDKLYISVESLIHNYLLAKKPITVDSMCLITSPVKRPFDTVASLRESDGFVLSQETPVSTAQHNLSINRAAGKQITSNHVQEKNQEADVTTLKIVGKNPCNSSSLLTEPTNHKSSSSCLLTRHSDYFLRQSENDEKFGLLGQQQRHESDKCDEKMDTSDASSPNTASPTSRHQSICQQNYLNCSSLLADHPVCYMPCGGIKDFVKETTVNTSSAKSNCSGKCMNNVELNFSMQTRPLPPVPMALCKGDRDSGIDNPPAKPHAYGTPISYGFSQKFAGRAFDRYCESVEVDMDENNDYHEYCDIDYDEPRRAVNMADGVVFRTVSSNKLPTRTNATIDTTKGFKSGQSSSVVIPKQAPPLPPRPKDQQSERDSACVPDIGIYDKVNSQDRLAFQRLFHEQLESRINLQNFRLPKTIYCTSSHSMKPLDNQWSFGILDSILGLSCQRLCRLICEADSNFLDTRKSSDPGRKRQNNFLSRSAHNLFFDLFLIPSGRQYRIDVLERHNSWRRFVQATLLKTEQAEKRTTVLAKWIDIAQQLYSTYANFFAFGYIMAALASEQVCSLDKLWHKLRADFTDLALLYETQLKPAFVAFQRNPCGPIIKKDSSHDYEHLYAIPDLEPMARLLEADSAYCTWLFDWEDADETFGIDMLWNRLSEARKWIIKRSTTETDIDSMHFDACVSENDFLIGMTEFHLIFLWGSNGAKAQSAERYQKLDLLMTLMAESIEADCI